MQITDYLQPEDLRIDGQNVANYMTNGLEIAEKLKRQETNMSSLLDFLNSNFNIPIPIIVLPKIKKFLKKPWSPSPWICFIEDQRRGIDDYWIINSAIQSNSYIITNDRYSNWKINREFFEKRLIRFEIIGTSFTFDLPSIFENEKEEELLTIKKEVQHFD